MTRHHSRLSLKGLKTFIGNEGRGYNFTLLIDGRKAAFVINDASGGCTDFQWERNWPGGQKIWDGIVADSPPIPADPKAGYPEMKMSDDILAEDLVNQAERDKKYRRICKTKTVFCKPDQPDLIYTMPQPFTPPVKAHLVAKYGDQVQILNEFYSK